MIFENIENKSTPFFRFMNQFVIPPGEPSAKITHYENLMRNAMVMAGEHRQAFIEYKRLCRRFHIKSVDTEEHRTILSTVNEKYISRVNHQKNFFRAQCK